MKGLKLWMEETFQLINLNGMSRPIENLSGGLVLPEWAGITVTRILLTDSWYLATGGSIFDAKYICYDIVGDMVRYESYDMCVDERRDWHALGESWKSIFQ